MRFRRLIFVCFLLLIFLSVLSPIKFVDAAPGTSSFVGYWKLDETTQGSNAIDSSGYVNTAIANGSGGGPLPSADVPYTTFPNYRSSSFNGSNQYFEIASSSSLNPTSAVTLSVWIKLASTDSSYHTIAGKWDVGARQQYLIQINDNGKLGFWTGDGSTCADSLESTGTIAAGSWLHVVGVQSGTAKTIYINGVQNNSKTSTCSLGTSSANFTIGSKWNASSQYFEFFNGKIDDVRVYSRALSSTEINELANGNQTSATWTGSSSTNFETAGNWNINAIPEPFTKFTIAATANIASLSANEQIGGLIINSGGIFNLAGFNLTMNDYLAGVSGLATSSGTIVSKNSETLTNFVLPTSSGTVMFNNTSSGTGLIFGNTYNNLNFNDSLLRYWKFDESAGSAADSSGWSSALTNNNVTYVPGKINNAGSFNGSNTSFSGTGPPLANNSFSISAWIYANSLGADRIWFEQGSSSSTNNSLVLRLKSAGGIRFGFFLNDLDTADGVISAGAWYQVTVTYNAVTRARAIYVNGVQKASNTASNNFTGDTSMTIGTWNGFERWNGYIDDLRIFNRVMSASEIANLAAKAPPNVSVATTTINNNLTVNGNLFLNSGALDASSSNYNVTVTGNFENNGGVFVSRNGSVILNGINQSINGGNNFYNLTKNVLSASTLTFAEGFSSTISGTLSLSGASGNLLALRSSLSGRQFNINPEGTRSLSYLNPQDSNNINSSAIAYDSTFNYGTNLTNWIANGPTPVPANNSDSNSNNSSCSSIASNTKPNLFQINPGTNSVILYFSPVLGVDSYSISYGLNESANQFGISFNNNDSSGVVVYKINDLSPGTKYYFKVRGANGCSVTSWSNIRPQNTLNSTTFSSSNIIKSTENVAEKVAEIPVVEKGIEKKISVKKVEVKNKQNIKKYMVKAGDNLWNIAQEVLGAGTKYVSIIEKNSKKYPEIASNLKAGTQLEIDDNKPPHKEKKTNKKLYDLDVKILASNNMPLEGVKVTLHSTPRTEITNKNGVASFKNIEEGKHKVYLAYKGYDGGGQSININGNNKDVQLVMQIDLTAKFSKPAIAVIIILVCIILLLLFILLRKSKAKYLKR